MAKENILIVDDEEDVLELVRYNLDKNGYKIETAKTGEEALTKARAKLPDMVILDLMLPGIDGLSVCKKLKGDSKTQNIPVIMLTAHSDPRDIDKARAGGILEYITKPFDPMELREKIANAMSHSKS